MFSQSGKIEKKEYFDLVFNLVKPLCTIDYRSKMYTWTDKTNNQTYSKISLSTMQLPCFNKFYDLFYKEKIKKVPLNIEQLLIPIGLAHWIMGDGSKHNNGLHLSVYAFNIKEAIILKNALISKFGLTVTIHNHKVGPRLYIWEADMPGLRRMLMPYFVPSMLYKLGL